MKTFNSFMEQLSETVHPAIKEIMNGSSSDKNEDIKNKIRELHDKGVSSGLSGSAPKLGSSRAVHFHTEPKKIKLDGKDASVPTVLKVAYKGHGDKDGTLMGEMQNKTESNERANKKFGILRKGEDGYETNHESGILAPHFDNHPDHHWVEHGMAEDLKSDKGFMVASKTEDFPNGISHSQFYHAVNAMHREAHGKDYASSSYPMTTIDKLKKHPLVQKAFAAVSDSSLNLHPTDLTKDNIGIFRHPHTGEKHIVIRDYGFSKDVAKTYLKSHQKD